MALKSDRRKGLMTDFKVFSQFKVSYFKVLTVEYSLYFKKIPKKFQETKKHFILKFYNIFSFKTLNKNSLKYYNEFYCKTLNDTYSLKIERIIALICIVSFNK
jgi:hypothetical protein